MYITGEIHARIDSDYGRTTFAAVEAFGALSSLALLGVSHAASEFFVSQREMSNGFHGRTAVRVVLLPEAHWWR